MYFASNTRVSIGLQNKYFKTKTKFTHLENRVFDPFCIQRATGVGWVDTIYSFSRTLIDLRASLFWLYKNAAGKNAT